MFDWQQRFSKLLWSISGRLLVVMLLTSLLPMGAVVLYNQSESSLMMEDAEIQALKLLAIGKARSLDQLINDVLSDARLVAEDYEIQRFLRDAIDFPSDHTSIQSLLRSVNNLSHTYNDVILLNREGRSIQATDPALIGDDYSQTELWQQGVQENNFVSTVKIKSTIANEPVFVVFQRIRDNNQRLLGAVLLTLRAAAIKDIITYLVPDIRGESFLIDHHGLMLSSTNPNIDLHSLEPLSEPVIRSYFLFVPPQPIPTLSDRSNKRLRDVIFGSNRPGTLAYSENDDRRPDHVLAYAPLARKQAAVVVSVRLQEFLAPLDALAMRGLVSLLFVGGGVIVISLVVAQSITRPIRAIATAARNLKNDRFDASVLTPYTHSQDDMGELAQTFLEMALEVEHRHHQLQQQLSDLKIEIDQEKRKKAVAEITETDYFQTLRDRAHALRQQAKSATTHPSAAGNNPQSQETPNHES
ncbi:cache and HAMP domain-containing protein [Synechococcus sp. PCC 6717]|nr:cache and HAMP domain-containing protein [Synechococcus sp. PCC 6717]